MNEEIIIWDNNVTLLPTTELSCGFDNNNMNHKNWLFSWKFPNYGWRWWSFYSFLQVQNGMVEQKYQISS